MPRFVKFLKLMLPQSPAEMMIDIFGWSVLLGMFIGWWHAL